LSIHATTAAAIMEQPVIEKILTHLGLQARAPPRAPACLSQMRAARDPPARFWRAGAQGCGDWLRQGFAEPRFGA